MRLQKKCYLLFGLCTALFFSCQTGKQNSQHLFTNELIHESSPYLLQHAHNPVNWYPWGEKALAKAQAEQKMLLVSVGYAACHWCHVMESECFEDTAVARLMNTYFVCIKVDREERPDIDNTYMTACQMIAGQNCGWPLNSIALPDGKPVWTGTYFPKKEWMERLNFFKDEWKKNRSAMETHAAKIASGIQTNTIFPDKPSAQALNRAGIDALANSFLKNQDPIYGGRRGAPKFPTPVNTRFLLEYGQSCGNQAAVKAAYTILDKMLEGGIYDHLGGGFARYATDDQWMVPHFEKMLYDNAQLVSLYAQAYLQSGNPAYKKVVYETLEFVQRELTSPEGAFYASLDADSEGAEGKFYVWKQAEIAQILGDAGKTAVFCDYFNVQPQGNWEAGANILQRTKSATNVAKAHQLTPEALEQQIAQSKKQLLDARARRIRPKLDDKALTAWNALMISAYVDAYKAFGEPGFLNAALKNAQLITQKIMQSDHRLLRNYKDNKAIINGFLDDYAATATAFQALYEVTFDEKWLILAKNLTEYALQHFQQKDQALLYYSSDLDPLLIARNIEIADQVIPASNSVMARNLFVLGNYFYNDAWVEQSQNMLRSVLSDPNMKSAPDFYSNWCRLYLNFSNPFYEIAIVGPEADLRRNELMAHFLPNSLLLGGPQEGTLELLKGKLQPNQTNIYVCGNKVCKKPVSATESALEILR